MKQLAKRKKTIILIITTLLCVFSVATLNGIADSDGASGTPSGSSLGTSVGTSDIMTPTPMALQTGDFGTCIWVYNPSTATFIISPNPVTGGNKFPEDTENTAIKDFPNIDKVEFADGSMIATNLRSLFAGKVGIKEIVGWENVDTSGVTDTSYMFEQCWGLTNIDIPFDTSNVTNMSHMFYNCQVTETITANSMDVSKVEDMSYMFYNCMDLKVLEASQWNTHSLTTTEGMFSKCYNLENFDFPWNMSNVTTLKDMFNSCYKLTVFPTLWDTSSVTDMSGTFLYSGLTSVENINQWDISNVTTISSLFSSTKLTEADLTPWGEQMKNITTMESLFYGSEQLTTVSLENWNTSNVSNMNAMFGMTAIKHLDLSNFSTEKAGDVGGDLGMMFVFTDQLETVDLSSFVIKDPNSVSLMFRGSNVYQIKLGDDFYFQNSQLFWADEGWYGPGYPNTFYTGEWYLVEDPTGVHYDTTIDFAGGEDPMTGEPIPAGYNSNKVAGTYRRKGQPIALILDGNGGISGGNSTTTINTFYNYPTKIDPPFKKTGYKPVLWTGNSNGELLEYDATQDVLELAPTDFSSNISLTLEWEAIPYTVSFDLNGWEGGAVPESQTHIYEETISAPPSPERRAFEFTGWYTDASCTNQWNFETDTVPAESITLYAGWKRTHWEVFFDSNGGNDSTLPKNMLTPIHEPLDIINYQPGASAVPLYSQNALLGWKDQNGEIIGNGNYIPTSDVYLTANWVSLPELITRKKENIVVYKNEISAEEIIAILDPSAEYTDYLDVFHTYPVSLDWNPVWLSEGGVNEIKFYIIDSADNAKVYGNEITDLYVLNRPYITGTDVIWIFEGDWLNPEMTSVLGYGESPNFEKKRIDRGPLELKFNDEAVDTSTAGTYWASFSGNFQDYDLKEETFYFPITVHVMKREGLTKEEQQQVDSSVFWGKTAEIYHTMKAGQVIDVNPQNYMDGGTLRTETVESGLDYDRQLNVEVGQFVFMSPDILNMLQKEKTGQLNLELEGRSWVFNSNSVEVLGKNFPKGYYDLRMDTGKNEAISALVGADVPQMQLHFSMNRAWFGTPTLVISPTTSIKESIESGKTPYLFHYNENTNELELVGEMKLESSGNLSIAMNGVYKDYVIVTALPAKGGYRITEHTNELDSQIYETIADNLIDSGHALPSGSGLNGISTTQYAQTITEGTIPRKSSTSKVVAIIGIFIASLAAIGSGIFFFKKRKDYDC